MTFAGSPSLSMTRRMTVVLVSLTKNSVCPENLISASPDTKEMSRAGRLTNKNEEIIPRRNKVIKLNDKILFSVLQGIKK